MNLKKTAKSWLRQLLIGAALSLGGLAFALLLFEVGIRLLAKDTPEQWHDRPKYFYLPQNAKDQRAQTHLKQKPANTFRIAVVGDSFSFGPFLQFDDTFSRRLERMLNLRDTPKKVEVINYGVPGYSTVHEIKTVESAIRDEGADLVLLQITLNDAELKPYRPTGITIETNKYGAAILREEMPWILKYWHSGQFIYRLWNANQKQSEYIKYFHELFEKYRSRESFKSSIIRIRDFCKKEGIPLYAVVFPLLGTPLDESYPFNSIHTRIHHTLERAHIFYLDLLNEYRGIPVERLQVMPGEDFHPNEIAHRMAAEAIYRWLALDNFLPEELQIGRVLRRRDHIVQCDNSVECCEPTFTELKDIE